MTFTEAALEALRREGKPLHFTKIVELAIRENLLDHVGKIPEETMADQLAAHARLPKPERRLLPVQHGTFALVEWGLDEDPAGAENLVEAPAEDLPIRARERHPIPLRDLSRRDNAPRAAEQHPGKERGRRRDEEPGRHGHRFPPPSEVAFEILAGAGQPLELADIAAQGAERLLMAEAFVRDRGSLRSALLEDNRRREGAGRKPLFAIDGDTVTLAAQPEPGERVALPAVARGPLSAGELRHSALAALRRRLRECDPATVEHVAGRLLEKQGFRELKVAKRGREHVIYTGRRRMGMTDVRHAIRVVRTGADAGRRDVTDLRRDLGNYGAQIGLVLSAGEATREARGEAGAAGQLPVLLVCGEAFAESLAEAGVGTVPVVIPELDEVFFQSAAEAAEKDEAARLARREERDRHRGDERDDREAREPRGERGDRREREPREPREPRSPREAVEPMPLVAAAAGDGLEVEPVEVASGEARTPTITVDAFVAGTPAAARDDDSDEGDDDEGDDDGPDDAEGAEPGAAAGPGPDGKPGESGQAEHRRRRRRRRRRGGRGRGREGQPGEGQPAAAEGQPRGEGSGPPSSGGEAASPAPAAPLGGEPPPA